MLEPGRDDFLMVHVFLALWTEDLGPNWATEVFFCLEPPKCPSPSVPSEILTLRKLIPYNEF